MKQMKTFRFLQNYLNRYYSVANTRNKLNNEEVRKKRNIIFNEELERQQSLVTRIEKIEVKIKSPPEECTLIMNKDISTPFECGRHIGEIITNRAVLAQVNGKLWDLHRPLAEDCELEFLHFKQENPYHVNQTFWRSCSFLMGLLIEKAFRNDFYVELRGWPKPNIYNGSFACDADLKMDKWIPNQKELNVLTTTILKICKENHKFEFLKVDQSVALRLFEDNRFKKEQVLSASAESNVINLYRVGDHIDFSRGPMISNTNLIAKFTVAAVFHMQTDAENWYRFQGVALPQQLPLNSFAYSILVKRAAKLIDYDSTS